MALRLRGCRFALTGSRAIDIRTGKNPNLHYRDLDILVEKDDWENAWKHVPGKAKVVGPSLAIFGVMISPKLKKKRKLLVRLHRALSPYDRKTISDLNSVSRSRKNVVVISGFPPIVSSEYLIFEAIRKGKKAEARVLLSNVSDKNAVLRQVRMAISKYCGTATRADAQRTFDLISQKI